MLRLISAFVAAAACAIIFTGTAAAQSTIYVSPFPIGFGVGTSCTLPDSNNIQFAVTFLAAPGDTVVVCDGVYEEQVTVDRNLTLAGSGNSVIKAPPGPLADLKDLVTITNSASVAMSGFIVAGPGPSVCGSIGAGIRVFNNATLDLSYTSIRDIRDVDPAHSGGFSGCQNGEAIRVGPRGTDPVVFGPGHATIDNVIALDFQKNGITVNGVGSTANIMNTTVRGAGPTPVIAQNGIQVSRGASATISTSTIRDHEYTLKPEVACGLLVFDANGVNDDTNIFLNNEKDKCVFLGRGGTYEGMP